MNANINEYKESPWNFNRYRLNNIFIDCFLKSKDEIYPCHRIILASKSRYFFEYFKLHAESEVNLPIDPQNFFTDVLDFLYTGNIQLNSKNIALACKISEYYQIDCLEKLIQQQFSNILSFNNSLKISKSLRDNDVHSKDDQITQVILNNFIKNKIENIKQVYSSISPNVLAKILAHFKDTIADELKIDLIEDYLLNQSSIILSEKDKEALSSTINWGNPNSYKYILHYQCDWVPSKIIRPIINQILDLRRTLIQNVKNDFALASGKVSKFYPLLRVCEIGNPDVEVKNEYDITHFLSTIGGMVKPFNIFQYGFIQIQNSNFIPEFYPHFIFDQNDDQHYFLSIGNDNDHPYLAFSFGKDAIFQLTKIEIQTSRPHIYQGQTFSPSKMILECFDELKDSEPIEKVELDTSSGLLNKKVSLGKHYQYYRIRMNEPDPIHSWVFRLLNLKIFGKFNSN